MVSFAAEKLDKQVWDAYLANWTGADFAGDLGNYAAATTLVVGDGDPFVTNEYLEATLSLLRNGSIVNLAGAGHYPMIEQQAKTVAIWEQAISQATAS